MRLDPDYDIGADARLAPIGLGVLDSGEIMPTWNVPAGAVYVERTFNAGTGHEHTDAVPMMPTRAIGAERRADIMATLRRTLPTIDAVHGLQAARTLAALRNDPRDRAERGNVVKLDNVGPEVTRQWSPVPDAMIGAQHTVSQKRSRKGTTTKVVKRYGAATVQGATDRDVNGNETSPAIAHLLGGARRRSAGVNAYDVLSITQSAYGDALPIVMRADGRETTLLGTDVAMREDVTERDAAMSADTTSRVASLAQHTADLFGSPVGAITEPTWLPAGRRSETSGTAWPERKVPRIAWRTSETTSTTRNVYVGHVTGPADIGPTYTVIELPAAHLATCRDTEKYPCTCETETCSSLRWQGHRLVTGRGPRADRSNEPRGGLIARTITLDTVPESILAWNVLIGELQAGTRYEHQTATGDRYTITRTSGGRFTGRIAWHDGTVARWTVRTSETLAERVAIALADQ